MNIKKFFQSNIGIVLLLILFFPIGLILMWSKSDWKPKTKWIVTGIVLLFVIFVNATNKTTPTNSTSGTTNQILENVAPTSVTVSKLTYEKSVNVISNGLSIRQIYPKKVDSMDKYIGFFDEGTANVSLYGTKDNITQIQLVLNKGSVDLHKAQLPIILRGLVNDNESAKEWLAGQLSTFSSTEGEYFEETSSYFHEAKQSFEGKQIHVSYSETPSTGYKTLNLQIKLD